MDFKDLSPEDQQAILQRVERARKEGPQLIREGRYADAFDLVYYAGLLDKQSMDIALRICHQVEGVCLLRPDQLDVLRQHAEEKKPLAQYLYGFWLWSNRPRQKDITKVVELLEAASDFGIGDASYSLGQIYQFGELGKVDVRRQHYYEILANKQNSFKAFYESVRDHIYGRNGEEERPDITIGILRDLIGLPDDTDLRWQEEREKELQIEAAQNAHPRLWTLLFEAYDAMHLRWAGELYAQMGIRQGDLDHGYLNLIIARCTDPKDEEGNIQPEKWDEYMRIVREGAEAGSRDMMNRLGVNLAIEYDDEETSEERREELAPQIQKWLERASELGCADASEKLALAYLNGEYGYEQDCDQLWNYMHRAAMQGKPSAYYSIFLLAREAQDETVPVEDREFLLKPDMDDLPAEEWESIGRVVHEAAGETWPEDSSDNEEDSDEPEQEIEED